MKFFFVNFRAVFAVLVCCGGYWLMLLSVAVCRCVLCVGCCRLFGVRWLLFVVVCVGVGCSLLIVGWSVSFVWCVLCVVDWWLLVGGVCLVVVDCCCSMFVFC